jgi:hypothetical protein
LKLPKPIHHLLNLGGELLGLLQREGYAGRFGKAGKVRRLQWPRPRGGRGGRHDWRRGERTPPKQRPLSSRQSVPWRRSPPEPGDGRGGGGEHGRRLLPALPSRLQEGEVTRRRRTRKRRSIWQRGEGLVLSGGREHAGASVELEVMQAGRARLRVTVRSRGRAAAAGLGHGNSPPGHGGWRRGG